MRDKEKEIERERKRERERDKERERSSKTDRKEPINNLILRVELCKYRLTLKLMIYRLEHKL